VKAFNIMIFLLIFNMSISLISAIPVDRDADGVLESGIFEMGLSTNSSYDVTEYENVGPADIVVRFIATSILGIAGGIIGGAALSWVANVPADSSIAYGAFVGTFWSQTLNSFWILWNLGATRGGIVQDIMMYFLFIFGAIIGVVFVAGMIQLVKGGWKSYK